MRPRPWARAALAALALTLALTVSVSAVGVGLFAEAASAHTLASSSVKLVVGGEGLDGTVALAVASLDEAFDAAHRSTVLTASQYEDQVVAYLTEHLTIQGSDGVPWTETVTTVARQTTEGIETFTVDLTVDSGGADPAHFAVTYDAIIEAVPDHEAVLVVEDSSGTVSTPGVFAHENESVVIGNGSTDVGIGDMVRLGFHHVVDGADHLLFLLTLLLTAPLVVAAGRWRRRHGVRDSIRQVLRVVTAFTVGHSLTLIAMALGWITVPSQPVEVLIALSVAVSALHAFRPVVRGGERVIALAFGLVHGTAFAGVLRDLGLDGRASVLALLAFNIGIEVAQLAATACVFPSLYLMSTRRAYRAVRVGGASFALLAAGCWTIDRLGLAATPFGSIEVAFIDHPWTVILGLAVLAVLIRTIDRRPTDHALAGFVDQPVTTATERESPPHRVLAGSPGRPV